MNYFFILQNANIKNGTYQSLLVLPMSNNCTNLALH